MNDNEVRKAPDALERVPEMLDTPPNRYHCISKNPQQTLGAFFVVDTKVGSNRPSRDFFRARDNLKIISKYSKIQ